MCGRIVVVQDPVAILPFFQSFSANWITQASQDLQVEFLVNCLSVGSVLVVYDALRIKKRSSRLGVAFNGGSTLFKWTEPVKLLCTTHCIFTVCLLQKWIRFRCGFSDFKTKPDANALFGAFTHRKNRYDINARVISATYYSQMSKRSHLQLVSWVAKTCTNMSRLVANTSHPVNNHYNSNPDTVWTNLI